MIAYFKRVWEWSREHPIEALIMFLTGYCIGFYIL